MDNKKSLGIMGTWTLLGLIALLVIGAFAIGVSLPTMAGYFYLLFTGNFDKIPWGLGLALPKILAEVVIAILVIQVPVSYILAMLFNHSKKGVDSKAIESMLNSGPWLLFALVAAEELFARGLFLGLLTKLIPGNIAFYVFFVLGNLIWAMMHFSNYKDPSDRKLANVLPQLFSGVIFTYIFIRFGIVVGIMAHYFFDVILMSAMKEKDSWVVNVINGVYYLILGAILWFVAGANGFSLSSLGMWFNGVAKPLDGYGFWGYVVVILLVDCIVSFASHFLLMDPPDVKEESYKQLFKSGCLGFLATSALVSAFYVLMILGGNYLLGLFIPDIAFRAVILTLGLSMISSSSSGSSIARSTIVGLPSTFLTVMAFSVLGFWPTVGICLCNLIATLIPSYMESTK